MAKEVLFIQGAGAGAYNEDKKLAGSLRRALESDYDVRYPVMPDEGNAPYDQWKRQIETELATMSGPVLLVGHSVGAAILAKCLTEIDIDKPVAGIFLISTPYWGGDGWRYEGYQTLELPRDFASRLPQDAPVFLYHAQDDETVPFSHLALYASILPQAKVREIDSGGHQLNNDLTMIANDIKSVE
ncbi:MAG TPA: alpha/beta hydrolase [Ktedonobacterales bacterium]|nr:alpha/beta hydrolase [Ktedonobacterales bacterium]